MLSNIITKKLSVKGIEILNNEEFKSNSYHLYIIKIKKEFGISRDKLFLKLSKKGISTSVHYKPLHKFTIFKKKAKIYGTLKNSSKIYNEILSLPLFPSITKKEQNIVIQNILKYKK